MRMLPGGPDCRHTRERQVAGAPRSSAISHSTVATHSRAMTPLLVGIGPRRASTAIDAVERACGAATSAGRPGSLAPGIIGRDGARR